EGSVDLEVVEGAPAPGPGPGPAKEPVAAGKPAFKVSLDPARPTPGGKATLIIGYEVPKDARLYALDGGAGFATRIEVDPRFAAIDGAPTSSPARTIVEDGEERHVLEGTGEIRVPVVIARDAPPGGGTLAVSVFHAAGPGAMGEERISLPLNFSFGWL